MYRTLLLLFICYQYGYTGFASRTAGGRHAALAGADLALAGTVWSLAYNPASLIDVDHFEGSVSASPQPFGLQDLASVSLGLAVPGPAGVIGFGADRFGFDLFREVTYSIGYAFGFSGLDAGITLNYYSFSISRYGSSGTFGLDAGVRIPVTPHLRLAVEGENINTPTVGAIADRLPQSFAAGIAWSPVDMLTAELDYRKDIHFDPTPCAGVECWMAQFLALRFGFSQTPPIVSAGLGISWSVFELDYAYSSHQELGGTQQFSLTIREGR